MSRRTHLSFAVVTLILLAVASPLSAQNFQAERARKISAQPSRPSAEWVRDGIIYEIYPRSFSSEGTFAGIEKRLPELKALGVTILWLMPIHPVGVVKRKGPLGSPYSISDYYGINPEFGTLDDFKRLLTGAHALGFHLIIDLVANHTSWDSKIIREHPEWFKKDSAGTIVPPNPDWTDVAHLDYSKPALRRYMIDMLKYWVRDVGIDGFRCDVSEMVPVDFWNEARTALDSIRTIMMLSEGADPEQHLKAFDITYDWDVYHVIAPVLSGEATARDLDRVLNLQELRFPKNALHLRFSSNHDENAWDMADVEKFGVDGAKLAAVLVNTLPGVPLLYNGQESGNPVKLKLFEKVPIQWNSSGNFREFYTKLYRIRASHPALTEKTMERIPSSNDRQIFAYLRIAAHDTVLVVLNFGRFPFEGVLDFSQTGIMVKETAAWKNAFSDIVISSGMTPERRLFLTIPATGFGVYSLINDSR
ncbi:MAG: alpha-amylase family glycosyl hydrolase [Ignavibacteriales bacterium]|nr:alpha-amylase family glycosyl hydrolase [Ignavibacteriales bacterium]